MDDDLPPLVERFFESGHLPAKLMIEHQQAIIAALEDQILNQERTIASLRKWVENWRESQILTKLDEIMGKL